jgi:WD40 repeat protein/uncharacterized caspase-like protein
MLSRLIACVAGCLFTLASGGMLSVILALPTSANDLTRIQAQLPHARSVTSLAVSPDGRLLASGSIDRTVKLWDLDKGPLVTSLQGHVGMVHAVGFADGGSVVFAYSEPANVGWRHFPAAFSAWETATGTPISGDGLLQLRIRALESKLTITPVHNGSYTPSATSSTHSAKAVVKEAYGEAKFVILQSLETGAQNELSHHGSVKSIVFTSDEARLITAGDDGLIRVWDTKSGQLLRTMGRCIIESCPRSLSPPAVTSLDFSEDGTLLYAGTDDGNVYQWSTSDGRLLRAIPFEDGPISSIAITESRTLVVSAKSLSYWDLATSRNVGATAISDYAVNRLALSPDGSQIAAGAPDKIRLLEPPGIVRGTFSGSTGRCCEVAPVAFSADGKFLISTGWGGDIAIDPIRAGPPRRILKSGHDIATALAVAPDGKHAATAGYQGVANEGLLKIWNARSWRAVREMVFSARIWSLTFSRDSKSVLLGLGDGSWAVWSWPNKPVIIPGHAGSVTSVKISPEGRFIATASSDGSVRLWKATTRQPSTVSIAASAESWLTMTAQGFFGGARAWGLDRQESGDLLAIVKGLETTTVGEVHQSLFNPDLIREQLAGDLSGEVRAAAKVINLEKVIGSGPAPAVAIASPGSSGSPSATDVVTVTARIEDRGKGVGRVEWRVNGITAAVAPTPQGRGPVYTDTRELALEPGDNVIEVVAYNGSNLLASLPAHIQVKFTGPADKARGMLHILAIGINKYVDKGWPPGKDAIGFGPLGLAVKDATAFADAMRTAGGELYDEVRVTLALDEDATRANLHKLVDKVAAQIHPRDTFVLFAAAHGFSENGRFYLIPQDYQHGPPGSLAGGAISQDHLQDWLANRIKAKRAIVLLDTCESGALVAGHTRARTDGAASEAGVGRLHEATGRPVLTAAAAGQFAYEGLIGATGQRHGVFTWAVLEALRKGDTSGNGVIELNELVAYVQSAVPAAAATARGRGQAVVSAPVQKQAARFGSRGEDFAVARRLQ